MRFRVRAAYMLKCGTLLAASPGFNLDMKNGRRASPLSGRGCRAMQPCQTIDIPNCQTTLNRGCPWQLPFKGTGLGLKCSQPAVQDGSSPDSTTIAATIPAPLRAKSKPRPAGYHMAHTIPFQPSTHTYASAHARALPPEPHNVYSREVCLGDAALPVARGAAIQRQHP
jgi:hypothetical protein